MEPQIRALREQVRVRPRLKVRLFLEEQAEEPAGAPGAARAKSAHLELQTPQFSSLARFVGQVVEQAAPVPDPAR